MPRLARKAQAITNWFHLYNRGARQKNIFYNEQDKALFEFFLKKYIPCYPIQLHAFAMMNNHYHCIVRGQLPDISRFMHTFISNYVRTFNKTHGFDGPLFRSRFSSSPLKSEAKILQKIRYTHRNVLDIADNRDGLFYRWSSHRYYLDPSSCPEFLTIDTVLNMLSEDRKKAITKFNDFVRLDY